MKYMDSNNIRIKIDITFIIILTIKMSNKVHIIIKKWNKNKIIIKRKKNLMKLSYNGSKLI